MKIPAAGLLKTMIYQTDQGPTAVLVRGDREVNEIKLKNLVGGEPELAPPAVIEQVTGAATGFAGPVGLDIPILADHGIKAMAEAVDRSERNRLSPDRSNSRPGLQRYRAGMIFPWSGRGIPVQDAAALLRPQEE